MDFSHVDKAFGDKQVLRDFSLTLPERGTLVLCGPSGCGKTTLFSLLLGLISPDRGAVHTDGKRFSVVFQEDRLLEGLNAVQNIRFVCPQAGPALCASHLALVGLGEEDGPTGSFSGGMKRRVAIVRAVLFGGDVLLLDEPFKGIDEETRERVANYLLANWPGEVILLITHDPEEARLLHAAQIIELGGSTNER